MDTITPVLHRSNAWPYRRILRWTLAIASVVLILIVAAFGLMMHHMSDVPADLDLATTRRSEQGFYQLRYTSGDTAIPLNQLHSWRLHIKTPDGQPVNDAIVSVDGGMPQHGHGLPTQPQVTQNLGNGEYLVEGMKFQMSGWWVVDVTVDAHGQRDTVRFNLLVQ
jgi:hypothetical protein